jgi:hypothetical protein
LEDAERIHRVHLRNRGDARLALLSALANLRTNRFREADAALLPAVFPSSGDLAEAAAVRALVRAGQGRPELAFAAKEEFLALCSEFWKTADRAARVSGPAASRLDTLSKWRAEVLSVVSERK